MYGGSGKVRKDLTASDNEITEEVKQNSLRPSQILALLLVRCGNFKETSIEGPRRFGR
jgi:hypothetical protein